MSRKLYWTQIYLLNTSKYSHHNILLFTVQHLARLPLKLGHGWVITSHRKQFNIISYPHPGPRLNIKMMSYQYRKSHCGDKTVVRSSYLHNGIFYAGKTTYLYWIRALTSENTVSKISPMTYTAVHSIKPLIARFMGPTWRPSGADRTQVGPMLAPWTLLSGYNSNFVGNYGQHLDYDHDDSIKWYSYFTAIVVTDVKICHL